MEMDHPVILSTTLSMQTIGLLFSLSLVVVVVQLRQTKRKRKNLGGCMEENVDGFLIS
jgi:hypothetical protein